MSPLNCTMRFECASNWPKGRFEVFGALLTPRPAPALLQTPKSAPPVFLFWSTEPCASLFLNTDIIVIHLNEVICPTQLRSSKRDCHLGHKKAKIRCCKIKPRFVIIIIIINNNISTTGKEEYLPPPITAARGRRFRSSTTCPGW